MFRREWSWRSLAGGWVAASLATVVAMSACQSKGPHDEVAPPLQPIGENPDGGTPGGGNPDGGNPGGNPDGGGVPDGGTPDGGQIQFGGPGPWPIANTTYGLAQGILETPVVGTSTDETQNLWAATHDALYLLKPGEARFRRYSAVDGLHLQSNPVVYCDRYFGGGDRACPILGAAMSPGISEIVGGGSNEVFVGYYGNDEGSADWFDANRHTGKMDRVRLNADGSLRVDRFDLLLVGAGAQYWHDRTVYRMVFDHFIHRHELYVGTNHGVDRLKPDLFRYPRPDEWFDTVNREWMGDHLHPVVCYHATCASDPTNQRMGDWFGLAISPDGNLWVAGRWTAGKIVWVDDIPSWVFRSGEQTFAAAFGDPYRRPVPADAPGFFNEPVFRPPQEGDPVSLSAVSVAPDGRVWFASGPLWESPPLDVPYGVAVWDGRLFRVYDPIAELGMGERNVRDLIALPDGRILLAGPTTGLLLWNPATGSRQQLRAPSWLPDDRVHRIELDTMVNPPALHVSTETGATVIRRLPP
jgi:hypothetical protein